MYFGWSSGNKVALNVSIQRLLTPINCSNGLDTCLLLLKVIHSYCMLNAAININILISETPANRAIWDRSKGFFICRFWSYVFGCHFTHCLFIYQSHRILFIYLFFLTHEAFNTLHWSWPDFREQIVFIVTEVWMVGGSMFEAHVSGC